MLIRTIFWFSLVVMLIPVNPADLDADQRPVSTLETVGLAQSLYRDASGFCARNPQSCETGQELLSQFAVKAKTGLAWVTEQVDALQTANAPASQTDATTTSSVHQASSE